MIVITPEIISTVVDNNREEINLPARIKRQRALVARFRKEAGFLAREVEIQREAVSRQENSINRAIESVMLTKRMESLQLALRNYNRELWKLREMGGLVKPERFESF